MSKPTSKSHKKKLLRRAESKLEAKSFAESEVFEAAWDKALNQYKGKNPQLSEHPHIFAHNLSSLLAIEDFKQLLIEILLSEPDEEDDEDDDPSFSS